MLINVIILNSLLFGVIYIAAKGELKSIFLNSLDSKIHHIPVTKLTTDDIASNSNIEMLDNDELKISGVYYDIFKTEVIDGKTTYYCFNDKNEEFLEKTLTSLLSNPLKSTNARSLNIVKLIHLSGFIVHNSANTIVCQYANKIPVNIFNLKEVVLRIPTPPPETPFS